MGFGEVEKVTYSPSEFLDQLSVVADGLFAAFCFLIP